MKLEKLTWHGQEMRPDPDRTYGTVWVDTPAPVGGESVSMGSMGMEPSRGEDPTHYEVPVTVWGDYCGDSCARSNFRSLVRDYPETFVEVYGDYGSLYLAIPVDAVTEDLLEIFEGLLESYPLYDEEDHSQLEMEETDAALAYPDGWAVWDLKRAVEDAIEDADGWTDEDWQFVISRYLSITGDQPSFPYLEDAVNLVFPHDAEVTADLVAELSALGLEHDPRRPNPDQLAFPAI